MLLPALVIAVAVIAVVVLLLRTEQVRQPVETIRFPQPLPQPNNQTTSHPTSSPSTPHDSGVMGKVVLSLAPTLMNDERRVMDQLALAGGEVLQSDLPQLTGFSKATVSKAIHGLEVRGIVVREKHKWTYWCKVNPRLIERYGQPENVSLEPVS